MPGQVHHVARCKVDEQQPRHRVGVQVAQGVEEQVAGKVGDGQHVALHAHEAAVAAAMGDVHRAFAVDVHIAGDEERVGVADHCARGVIQAVAALGHAPGLAGDPIDRAQLDVFGAIAEGLNHIDRKPLGIQRANPTIQAIAAARVEVDAEQADGGPWLQGGARRVAAAGQAVDLQGVRVG